MPSTTLTIDQIEISPLNVRTFRPDAEDTAALEASILADGLMNPIVVHPMMGRRGKWGAVAGGRRSRAIRALVTRGDLPKDFAVKVDIREGLSDAELIEVSIAENLIRKDLRDHELYAAIARAKAKGHDPETIARQLGQPNVAVIRRWARLGELAKPVFAAFVEGVISEEVARAFAATADVELQTSTFERLKVEGNLFGNIVRAALKVGDREEARLLTFVGEGIYRAAGGGYELDLFADLEPDRGRVTDPGLLRKLADEKLASIREQVRDTTGEPILRFVPEPPRTEWGDAPDYQLQITPKRNGYKLALPAAARGKGPIVAHIAIDKGGEPVVTYWWASRKAKFGQEKEPRANVGPLPSAPPRIGNAINSSIDMGQSKTLADAAIKDEAGLSQDMVQVFRSLRKQILRALLIDDARTGGDVAVDYLVWAQLRMVASADGRAAHSSQIGMRSISTGYESGVSGALERIHSALGEQPAGRTIAQALLELQAQTFFTSENLDEAFLDYRCSADSLKRLAAAVVAGLALERSLNATGYDRTPHDTVVLQMLPPAAFVPGFIDRAVRRHWLPTEQLLGQLPKSAQLTIAAEFVDEPTLTAWGKVRAAELTHLVVRVVTGASPSIRADKREEAERWVHPLLRFEPPTPGPDDEEDSGANDVAAPLAEAAE